MLMLILFGLQMLLFTGNYNLKIHESVFLKVNS